MAREFNLCMVLEEAGEASGGVGQIGGKDGAYDGGVDHEGGAGTIGVREAAIG